MPRRDDLVFEAHQGLSGLNHLLGDWNSLLASIPDARFNQFPEWYRAYLTCGVPHVHNIWFVSAKRRGSLVGVFPLQLKGVRLGPLRVRLLGTIEDDELQLSDCVMARTKENQELLHALTQWLRTTRTLPWHELRLRKVSDESAIAYAAAAQLPPHTEVLKYYASAWFDTTGTFEQATPKIRTKFRSNLRRRHRIAAETGTVRFSSHRPRAELQEAFESFLGIESSGWKGPTGSSSAINCRPMLHAFYSALVRDFSARDACVINLLWHSGTPVAGQLCLNVHRTLNVLKVGFSEKHAKFAPGLLLLERVIRSACEDPTIDAVHLVNNPAWAWCFGPTLVPVWCYFSPNDTLVGSLIHAAFRLKHLWNDYFRLDEMSFIGDKFYPARCKN